MSDLLQTRELLSQQVHAAIAADPRSALPTIAELHKDTGNYLRDAVAAASIDSSWSEIADAIGVSKQAAHQRFKAYAKDVTAEIKHEHRAMKRSRRDGKADQAAQARARRDQLIADLRSAADELKTQG